MSERLVRATMAQLRAAREGEGQGGVPYVLLVRHAVELLGWGTMTYGCSRCEFEWTVWLSLGVEGPPSLRLLDLYVAAPFGGGGCPSWPVGPDGELGRCDGEMRHVRFSHDQEFAPCMIPDDRPRFVLDEWHTTARLHVPEPALVAARRWHRDREGAQG